MYMESKTRVRTESNGDLFKTNRGVKQGDPLSPKLFTCVLEMVFRKLRWDKKRYGININGRRLSNLRFADDVVLFANSAPELEEMLNDLYSKSIEVGLEMNPAKTKVMSNQEEAGIAVNGLPLEYCTEYTYLGQSVSISGEGDQEIRRRIRLAWGKFWSLNFIMSNKFLSLKLKFDILQSCVIPVLLYGCQTWALTKRQANLLECCQRKFERKILGFRLTDRIRNQELRGASGMEDAASRAHHLKWNWAGHIIRMHPDRWTYATTTWDPRLGQRNRGRPRLRWSQPFETTVGAHWTRLAGNRGRWKEFVRALFRTENNSDQ